MFFFCHLFFFLNLFYLCHILFHFDDTVQPPNNGVTTLIYLTLFETFQMYVYTAKGLLQIYWISVHVTMLFTLLLGECTFKCTHFISNAKWMVHLTYQMAFIFRIILINGEITLCPYKIFLLYLLCYNLVILKDLELIKSSVLIFLIKQKMKIKSSFSVKNVLQ